MGGSNSARTFVGGVPIIRMIICYSRRVGYEILGWVHY